MNNDAAQKTETLYYDGHCPLCTAEMERLGNLKSKSLDLVDIHQLDTDDDHKTRMLQVLHLETASGDIITGLDANVAAWQHTRWGFAWRWLRWPVIRLFADAVYDAWAVNRFNRMYLRRPTSLPDK